MLRIGSILFLGFLLVASCFAELPAEKTLLNQEVTVLRGDFKEFHFLVPEDGQKWEFRGEFKSSGGFKDDITFIAMTQGAYVRWFSHFDYKSEVKLEKKKDGVFRFEAKPGETYYFVLDNFFSSVSSKKVRLNVKLVPM